MRRALVVLFLVLLAGCTTPDDRTEGGLIYYHDADRRVGCLDCLPDSEYRAP